MALLVSGPLWGQFQGAGVKFGLNIGSPFTKPVEGATGSPGITTLKGAFARFGLPNEKLEIQADVLFSLKASNFTTPISGDTIIFQYIPGVGSLPFPADYSATITGQFRNHYLEVPVVLRYVPNDHWAVLAGGYGAYLLQGDNTGTADVLLGNNFGRRPNEPFDQTEFLFPWDYGVIVGTEYRYDYFFVEFRMTMGMGSVYERDYPQVSSPVRNLYAQFSIGAFLEREQSE